MNQITPISVVWAEAAPAPRFPADHPNSMRSIASRVAEKHGLTLAELRSERRAFRFARPRQEAMALMCDVGIYSLPQIGRYFSRHHATVIHARRVHALRQAQGGQP